MARRVRERREALQARVRQKVNLYAPHEVLVETVEEEETAEADAADSGAARIAGALMGL